MKKIFKYAMLFAAATTMTTTFTACSDSSNGEETANKYKDRIYGNEAVEACEDLCDALTAAYEVIGKANLSAAQEAELKAVLANDVDAVIVPTYTDLATAVEKLRDALGTLSASQVSQTNVDAACAAFKTARQEWERSEAFLMGPAAGFDIDPHIDSWPLDRSALHSYFKNPTAEIDDESILGFHALEFILFRDGKNRSAESFRSNDTYKGLTDITGAQELAYAEAVIADLYEHVCELQVSWDPSNAAARLSVVQNAGLEYQTTNGNDFGTELKNPSTANNTFGTNLKEAIQQVLSLDDGSCLGIANEVGTAKIANPFTKGYIFYVESPYSYNSITDFQDNIRSIRNVWYGSRNGSAATHSFSKFFADNSSAIGRQVETAIDNAISKIGAMPYPFVQYVSTIWNKSFENDPVIDLEEE